MQLIDSFGRTVNYVRLSVTDRCDLRCVYCMAEEMTFLPRQDVLSIEEFTSLGRAFVELGVTKLRITGGEPLVRRGTIELLQNLGQLPGLKELCLTTNGTHLPQYARAIRDAGVKRINISLDSLKPERFHQLTRFGDLNQVLAGIKSAQAAGLKIKLNCVALKHYNADEVPALVQFALDEGLDISFIEEMPLGKINDHGRAAEYVSSDELRNQLSRGYQLLPLENSHADAGPSRYWQVDGFNSRIGFISPHSHNFCGSCNRVRVTATGRLLLCLGNEHSVDLRKQLRAENYSETALRDQIISSMQLKPEKHFFNLNEEPQIVRFMNMTGG
ncbi:MAG: cyclic pyranopterin phosphate synthase MoaA [Cellvibrio sp. 79]|nr:MAG: cyclic pyranopterin phosphate synthase MoaA [Cellvibrio sp. 79]